jgi:hypothetical protein
MLTGGVQPWIADMSQYLSITNLSANTLPFHLFWYSDFDLATPGNDVASIIGTDPLGRYDEAHQSDSSGAVQETTAVTEGADYTEVAPAGFTLSHLTNGFPYTLNDN